MIWPNMIFQNNTKYQIKTKILKKKPKLLMKI